MPALMSRITLISILKVNRTIDHLYHEGQMSKQSVESKSALRNSCIVFTALNHANSFYRSLCAFENDFAQAE